MARPTSSRLGRGGSHRRGALRRSRVGLACVAAALALIGCARRSSEPGAAKHVILISIDTARADHFGFMGSERVRTPRLDAFAGESIVFTDYMTVVPTTLASHTSLLTGKYPHHHGTPRNGFMVNGKNEMLPEILKAAGFHTAGFAGSFALDSRFDFAQGFDHYDQDFDIRAGQWGAEQDERSAARVTDAVIRYLDDAGIPSRLFLFVHYFDPHRPYSPPPPYETAYDPEGRRDLPRVAVLLRQRGLTPEQTEQCVRRLALQYAAEISYTDEHVGRLLDDLKRRGILDQALVVVTSDHGECLWEHGEEFDHGRTVYQSTMRALCAMRLPGGELGGTGVGQLVANIDVLPTTLDFLGLAVPLGVDGEAIPLLTAGEVFAPRTRFGEATKPRGSVETDPRWTNIRKSRCVREGRHKLIVTPYMGTQELYDVVADPDEVVNLLESPSAEIERLAADLGAKLQAWTESAHPLPSQFEPSQQEETKRRLRSLGYLQ